MRHIYCRKTLTEVKTFVDTVQESAARQETCREPMSIALTQLTKKTLNVLLLLAEGGTPSTVLSSSITQQDLARKLHVTRQALSIHMNRLAEAGFIQVGRGFVNLTEDGLKAVGYRHDPVILTVRVNPQSQREAYEKIKRIHASEIFRVAGDADFVLLVEHKDLDRVLQDLYSIHGTVETKSFVATETLRQPIK